MDKKYRLYLKDLGPTIRDRAFRAKESKASTVMGTEEFAYESGRLMAFNEVISIMRQQAEGFDIPLSDMGLEGIDPDKDLV